MRECNQAAPPPRWRARGQAIVLRIVAAAAVIKISAKAIVQRSPAPWRSGCRPLPEPHKTPLSRSGFSRRSPAVCRPADVLVGIRWRKVPERSHRKRRCRSLSGDSIRLAAFIVSRIGLPVCFHGQSPAGQKCRRLRKNLEISQDNCAHSGLLKFANCCRKTAGGVKGDLGIGGDDAGKCAADDSRSHVDNSRYMVLDAPRPPPCLNCPLRHMSPTDCPPAGCSAFYVGIWLRCSRRELITAEETGPSSTVPACAI